MGDVGEVVAAELFGVEISPRNSAGIDGYARDGRSVQVKATGTGRGPAFRCVQPRADHLLVFAFDFERLFGRVVFNGPEKTALSGIADSWVGQKAISMRRLVKANETVDERDRLPLLNAQTFNARRDGAYR